MSEPISIQKFMQLFPDDDACLEHLFKVRYGTEFACLRCGLIGKFNASLFLVFFGVLSPLY
jgi:transposase